MISNAIVSLVLIATTLTSTAYGFCLPPQGWHAKSLVERIELDEVNLAIVAYVDAVYPGPHGARGPYTADLSVMCVYKDTNGAGSELPLLLKGVEGFGGSWDCANTKVEAGRQYIMLLHREGDGLKVAEVNNQEGAEEALPSRVLKVEEKYSCIEM